jgi:hypothetical protein
MALYLDLLLGKAFDSMPGEAYNRYRLQASEAEGPPRFFYEVSLLEERPWAYLRDRVYPSFVRYLRLKSLNPEDGRGLTVAVFHGSRCYLLRGEDFLAAFREMEGMNPAAFRFRVLQWLSS